MIIVYDVKLICPFSVAHQLHVSPPGCSQEHQRIISLETEIDGYKRSTQKEQEQNEKLMMILNKAENDIATIRKQMAQCQTKLDALKNEYATYTRMLLETEQSLNRANAVSVCMLSRGHRQCACCDVVAVSLHVVALLSWTLSVRMLLRGRGLWMCRQYNVFFSGLT